jgi:hypothetical protein
MKNNSSSGVLLMALAGGAEDVKLEGENVTGRWRAEPIFVTNRLHKHVPSIVEQFANIDSPKAIVAFTKRFGPLVTRPERGDLAFRQSLSDWRDAQNFVRRHWSSSRNSGHKIGMRSSEEVHLDKRGKISALALESLRRFLEFELWTTPRVRRMKCTAPDCGTPFVIATRADQKTCDDPHCKKWAQRTFKRKWWAANGERWRKERAKKQGKAKRSR